MNLGPYYLYSPPFEGGLCKIFKASRFDRPGQFFAIKIPLDENNYSHINALRREAKVLSKVRHPNIIKLLEAHLEGSPPYIVLEYLPGGSLRTRVGNLSYGEVIFILYRVSSALDAIHQVGGFHRDIKPDNILVSADGDIILADVNIANVPSTNSSLTRSIAGTPGYIDPWVVNQPYDSKADIYSLGITIMELLTGRDPKSLVNASGLSVGMSMLPIQNDDHKRAFYNLIKAMTSNKRDLRPKAHAIHHYALSLLNGGPLPPLPTEKKYERLPTSPPSIGGILIVGALVILLFVGIAALARSK